MNDQEQQQRMDREFDFVFEKTGELFLRDGKVISMFFLYTRDGLDILPVFDPHSALGFVQSKLMTEEKYWGVVMICECWIKDVAKNDHTLVQLAHGEMRVSNLPDKEEAITVYGETRSGYKRIQLQMILRGMETVALGEKRESDLDTGLGGLFSRLFPSPTDPLEGVERENGG